MKDISPCSGAYPQYISLITPGGSLVELFWAIKTIHPDTKIKCTIKLRKESETLYTLFPLHYQLEENDLKNGRFDCGLSSNKEKYIQ